MTTAERQPILTDDAAYTIQHVNEDHLTELLYCVRAFTAYDEPQDARMVALYPDGIEVEILSHGQTSHEFIAYRTAGAPHEDIRGLVAAAMKKLGIRPEGGKRQAQWTVTANQPYATYFRRITFDLGGDDRSDWQPGHACRFVLPDEPHEGGQPETRPYTLRRVQGPSVTLDVYMHDASPGSRWAMGLGVGDEVQVIGHRAETFPDFGLGAALLLGDETALPTIAALLDTWAEEHPLRVLLEVEDAAEQRYLDDVCLPPRCHVSWLPRRGQPGDSLLATAEALETPVHAVWGATETSAARKLRVYFKHEKDLTPEQGRVIGYWSAERT